MDEFHSFADLERGIVWELSLAMLPPQARLLLLSATVGNAAEFVHWLHRCHGRKVELVIEGLNLEGQAAAASTGARYRSQVAASGLVFWSRGWLAWPP